MKKSTMVQGLAAALMLLSLPALSQETQGSSGVVQFRGAIVEDGCKIQNRGAQATFYCFKDGKIREQTLSLNRAKDVALRDANARVSLAWLDASHRLGVMQISYQ